MVVKKNILVGILLLVNQYSCSVKIPQMTFKEPFALNSESLGIGDGYYYKLDKLTERIQIFIFFENGKLFEGHFDSFEQIDKYLNDDKNKKLDTTGGFRTSNDSIRIKYYVIQAGNEFFSKWGILELEGRILSDGRIFISSSNDNGKVTLRDYTYVFRKNSNLE